MLIICIHLQRQVEALPEVRRHHRRSGRSHRLYRGQAVQVAEEDTQEARRRRYARRAAGRRRQIGRRHQEQTVHPVHCQHRCPGADAMHSFAERVTARRSAQEGDDRNGIGSGSFVVPVQAEVLA